MPPDGDLCTCFACENGGANGGHHISPDPNCEHCREFDPSPSSLYYSSSLGYVSAPLSDSEKLRRVVTAIGAGLKGGLAIFSILVRLRRRKLLASLRHYSILLKGLLGTARSRLFLSVYCSSAWAWTCFLFRIFRRCNIPMVAMGTFPTGLALAIEKKSRRIEISLYSQC